MKVQGMNHPGRFKVEQIPDTNKSLIRLFQNVVPITTEDFNGFQYDEYHVEVETWNGIEENVENNYDAFLKKGKDNEIDRSNDALYNDIQKINPEATIAATVVVKMMVSTMSLDDGQRITVSALYDDWKPGISYKKDDIRNANGQTWECFQSHDTMIYPDISPDGSSWLTFWRPLHGNTPETARPFVEVQGAHDIYKSGEFMIWMDGSIRECIRETSFGPVDDAEAWNLYESKSF